MLGNKKKSQNTVQVYAGLFPEYLGSSVENKLNNSNGGLNKTCKVIIDVKKGTQYGTVSVEVKQRYKSKVLSRVKETILGILKSDKPEDLKLQDEFTSSVYFLRH